MSNECGPIVREKLKITIGSKEIEKAREEFLSLLLVFIFDVMVMDE